MQYIVQHRDVEDREASHMTDILGRIQTPGV